MNMKSSVVLFSLILAVAPVSTLMQTAEAGSFSGKEKQNNKKNRSKKKKAFFTCDAYSRETLLKKAEKYLGDIDRSAKKHKVSAGLIKAVITVESCFRHKAKSSSGAVGLMQLMPGTAKRFGITDRLDTSKNISAGTRYLKFLLKRYNGDIRLVAAAYNAGEGAVDKYNGIPPYKETQTYVKRVMNAYSKLKPQQPQPAQQIAKKTSKHSQPKITKTRRKPQSALQQRFNLEKAYNEWQAQENRKKYAARYKRPNRLIIINPPNHENMSPHSLGSEFERWKREQKQRKPLLGFGSRI